MEISKKDNIYVVLSIPIDIKVENPTQIQITAHTQKLNKFVKKLKKLCLKHKFDVVVQEQPDDFDNMEVTNNDKTTNQNA